MEKPAAVDSQQHSCYSAVWSVAGELCETDIARGERFLSKAATAVSFQAPSWPSLTVIGAETP